MKFAPREKKWNMELHILVWAILNPCHCGGIRMSQSFPATPVILGCCAEVILSVLSFEIIIESSRCAFLNLGNFPPRIKRKLTIAFI